CGLLLSPCSYVEILSPLLVRRDQRRHNVPTAGTRPHGGDTYDGHGRQLGGAWAQCGAPTQHPHAPVPGTGGGVRWRRSERRCAGAAARAQPCAGVWKRSIRAFLIAEEQRRLCYDQHHVWMVTVIVTLSDILPCVLRGAVGPVDKDSSSPTFWRTIQRYGISRRLCRSIRCSASTGQSIGS